MKIAIWQTTDRPGASAISRSGDWRMLIRIVAATMVFVAATMFFAVALPVAVPAGVCCRQ